MTPFKLSKRELEKFNQGLTECQAIKEDLERAKQAGVPNIEMLEEALNVCKERIEALKAAYSPRNK